MAEVVEADRRQSVLTLLGRAVASPLTAAAAGAVVAAVASYLAMPQGGVNLDELTNLNLAEAIRHGHLTLPAETHVPDFRPYLSGIQGDAVVFKYQPLWPALLAAAQALTGDHRPGLVLAGALVALAFWLLGREVTRTRWGGSLTALAGVCCPWFFVNSATALAYLPAAGLTAAALGWLLRGVRTESRWRLAVAGGLFGALFFHRAFDGMLVGVPAGAWLVCRSRADPRRLRRELAVVAMAALPFVGVWAAFNAAVAGGPLTPAFSLDATDDRFGFGERASFDPVGDPLDDAKFDFGPRNSLETVGTFAWSLRLWLPAGLGCVALALLGVGAQRRRGDVRTLAAVTVAIPVGYFFWWGTANLVAFGLHRSLGPGYWLPILGPVVALGVVGVQTVVRRAGRFVVAVGGACLLLALLPLGPVSDEVEQANALREHQTFMLEAPADVAERTLLLQPVGPGNPFVTAEVPYDLQDADRLTAVDLGTPEQRFRLHDRFASHTMFLWYPLRPAGTFLDGGVGYELRQLTAARSAAIELELAAPAGSVRGRLRILDETGTELDSADLEVGGQGWATTVSAGDLASLGGEPGWLSLGAVAADTDPGVGSEGDPTMRCEIRLMVRVVDGEVEVLLPAYPFRRYELPAGDLWIQEDAPGFALTVDDVVEPAPGPVVSAGS